MGISVLEFHTASNVEVYRGPQSWNNLSRDQLLFWCGVLRQELTREEALLLAAIRFYNLPASRYKHIERVHDLNLVWKMEWLLDNTLTKNVLGKFRLFFTVYYGPANSLGNLTIGEYRQTELFYDMYIRTGLNKYLYLLCAVLFRPKGKGSADDVRCALTMATVDRRAAKFRRYLHPNYIKAIQLQYEGCRQYIRGRFPLIYPKASVEPLGPFDRATSTGIQDLQDHILAFSGDKLGTYADTENTNLFLFLKHMSLKIEEYNERKRK